MAITDLYSTVRCVRYSFLYDILGERSRMSNDNFSADLMLLRSGSRLQQDRIQRLWAIICNQNPILMSQSLDFRQGKSDGLKT
jgi:hypothetical protein